jgi:deoxyguanosine kinase
LIVNAAQVDFVSNDADYAQLVEQVLRTKRGRHYFNPMKTI